MGAHLSQPFAEKRLAERSQRQDLSFGPFRRGESMLMALEGLTKSNSEHWVIISRPSSNRGKSRYSWPRFVGYSEPCFYWFTSSFIIDETEQRSSDPNLHEHMDSPGMATGPDSYGHPWPGCPQVPEYHRFDSLDVLLKSDKNIPSKLKFPCDGLEGQSRYPCVHKTLQVRGLTS